MAFVAVAKTASFPDRVDHLTADADQATTRGDEAGLALHRWPRFEARTRQGGSQPGAGRILMNITWLQLDEMDFACLPDMRAARWGRICNIGSGVAREPATEIPHVLPNTVRPAVAGMYRILAARLAPHGITVNNILTGSILTERNASYWQWLADERGATVEEVTAAFHERIPLHRKIQIPEAAAE